VGESYKISHITYCKEGLSHYSEVCVRYTTIHILMTESVSIRWYWGFQQHLSLWVVIDHFYAITIVYHL